MQAQDVGATLNVPANLSLQTADSVSLIVIDPLGARSTLSMTVGSTALQDASGNTVASAYFWAFRLTTATDFVKPGNYQCQLVADFSGGSQNLASAPFQLYVGPRL